MVSYYDQVHGQMQLKEDALTRIPEYAKVLKGDKAAIDIRSKMVARGGMGGNYTVEHGGQTVGQVEKTADGKWQATHKDTGKTSGGHDTMSEAQGDLAKMHADYLKGTPRSY